MKKTGIKIGLLLIFGLIILSCNKIKTISIQGKVVNYYTNEPIDRVKVTLRDGMVTTSDGFFNVGESSSSGEESIVYTDTNGEFIINIEGNSNATFSMEKEGYSFDPDWDDGVSVGVTDYSFGNYSNQTFKMKGRSGFSPILKSKLPSYASDTLLFEVLIRNSNSDYEFYVLFDRNEFGEGPFTTFERTVYADTYQLYKLTLKRGGTTTVKLDSVYIKTLEIFNDIIYY